MDDIQVNEHMNYVDRAVAIVERKMKILHKKEIPLVKVQWQHRKGFEWTWEPKSEIQKHYPELFRVVHFEDEV